MPRHLRSEPAPAAPHGPPGARILRRRRAQELLALALCLLGIAELRAAERASPRKDPTTRAVLKRIQETYLEPDRIDPEKMLGAALRAVVRLLPGAALAEIEGGFELQLAGASLELPDPADGELPEGLAPAFERLLALLEERRAAGQEDLPETGRARAALLHGALRTLDRFSGAYIGGARSNLIGNFTGTAVGVGVMIGRRDQVIRVIEVYPGSGAAAAGLEAGDTVTRVDEQAVEGLMVSEISRLLRGEAGTEVRVFVERAGVPLAVTVTRQQYVKPSVTGRAEGKIGILRISHLSKNTPAQVSSHMERLAGQERVRMMILDLRNNSGGSMLAAAAIADLFLTEGVLLEALDRADRPVAGLRSRVEATRRGWPRMPLVVLMNGNTGSSAELLAAALAWHDRALLLGERTYGKNIVQKLHHFDADDLSVKISSAYMKTAGRRLPGEGLVPDIRVRSDGDESGVPGDAGGILLEPGDEEDPWAAIALRLLTAHGGPSRDAMVRAVRKGVVMSEGER